jgi:hypothetical protein
LPDRADAATGDEQARNAEEPAGVGEAADPLPSVARNVARRADEARDRQAIMGETANLARLR